MVCGLGNWVCDEVLYQARVDPAKVANKLKDEEVQALHREIAHVCSVACELKADSDEFPEDWLFHHRYNMSGGAGVCC